MVDSRGSIEKPSRISVRSTVFRLRLLVRYALRLLKVIIAIPLWLLGWLMAFIGGK